MTTNLEIPVHHPAGNGMRKASRLLLLLALVTLGGNVSAQNPARKGFSLGADRDTLLYIIASPFDNWWVDLGVSFQMFYGNEQDAEARWNPITPGVRAELGKWMLPDLAVSLRFSFFSVRSQGCYERLNPWLDKTHVPATYDLGYNYYPMSVNGMSALGFVTLDWTNFLCGYEMGKRTRWHLYTPVGMGGIWLFGKQINPLTDQARPERAGTTRWNKELAIAGGVVAEYYPPKSVFSFNLKAELIGTRGTIDWTYTKDDPNAPYPKRTTDFIPSLYAGVKVNLLHKVTKRDPFTNETIQATVNHEFISFGTRKTVGRLRDSIEDLSNRLDSLENAPQVDFELLGNMRQTIEQLENTVDSLTANQPANVMQEMIQKELAITVVYFDIDKYDIDRNARYRLRNFAHQMKHYDDTVEFYIIGAADSLTGTKRRNDWLSEKRCQEAYNVLVNDYGADPHQLIMKPLGGITAYEPKEENRMAMIVVRNKESDDIIARWSHYKK